MRRKEVLFACIVAISAFLAVAADTAFKKELDDDDGEQEIPTTESPKKIPSDEEFITVDGGQETTSTELPKKELELACAPPTEIEGSILPRSDSEEFSIGAHVAYSCKFGYVSRNSRNQKSTCIVNEVTGRTEWTVPEIACIPRSCGDPGYVTNGRRVGNLFTFPNKVEFECDAGYQLVGMKARFCQAGGEWSGRLPSCEPILCSVPHNPENGEVIYSSREYDAELTYRCNLGYMLTHKDTRYCDENGTWSGEAPECIETRCPKPIPPEHGEVNFIGEPKVGSIATYSCNPGMKLVGPSTTTKCLTTGQWTFDPPQCLRSCSVPRVEGGEMSKLSVLQISRWKTEQTYKPLSAGERVEHDAMLSFHCIQDFSIVEGDKILEDVRVNVFCYDGAWSKDLLCKQTSCLGDPPKTEHGKERVTGRTHGHTIWYKCDDPKDHKVPGNVTCHFGTWIGIPPQCLSLTPCYSKDLAFQGLVKPSQNALASSESFGIACKQGYRLSTSAKIISCIRGKWNVTEDPCPLAIEDTGQSRPIVAPVLQSNVEDQSPSTSNPRDTNPQPPEECHCIYGGAGHHVQAYVGNRRLNDGDKVRLGISVTFSCRNRGILTWKNEFRTYGNVSITCRTCQRWVAAGNPECKVLEGGGPFIVLDDSLEILPGGAVEVLIKRPITLRCASTVHYPQWSHQGQSIGTVEYSTRQSGHIVHHFTNINIQEIAHGDAGLYTCQLNFPGNFQRTAVELRVKENKCPLLANQFATYSKGSEIGSWVTFRCPGNTILVGNPQIVCQNDGTWSSPEPYCRAIECTFFPTVQDLKISYSDDNRVGSRARFSCPRHATLIGSAVSDCRSDGTWSFARPYCLNKTTCAIFRQVPGLRIRYSNGNVPGSNASFSCLSNKVLNGPSYAICLENGGWSHPVPSCEDQCSIGQLSISVKEGVIPDMRVANEEFVPFGSTVPLTCEEKFIPEGNSTAVCGEQGRWKIGKFECVSGCRLDIEPSSRLVVQPLKDSYHFGDDVLLSCPDGEKVANDVERLMCMGELRWSDHIPKCIES